MDRRRFFTFTATVAAATAAPKSAAIPSSASRDPVEEYRLRVVRLDVQGIKPIKTKLWHKLQRD